MQRHGVDGDAALPEPADELRREMQSGGRRGDRAVVVREHGLIVGAIARVGRAPRRDVGRQRHVAPLLDRLVEHGTMEREGERHLAALALVFDGGIELAEEAHLALFAEAHDVAGGEPLGRPHEGAPARAVEAPVQRRLDGGLGGAAADAAALQPRRNHLGVVDDERVTGLQQVRQIAHAAIVELRPLAPPGRTTSRRAASRGTTGRNAIRSGGRSKSNRSVRINTVIAHNRGR